MARQDVKKGISAERRPGCWFKTLLHLFWVVAELTPGSDSRKYLGGHSNNVSWLERYQKAIHEITSEMGIQGSPTGRYFNFMLDELSSRRGVSWIVYALLSVASFSSEGQILPGEQRMLYSCGLGICDMASF